MAYPDHMTHSISKLLILFCGCATNTIATAAERGPIALEPSSNWTVDYADDSCRLIRKFGAEDEIVFAIFNRFSPGDDFQLTVVGKPVALKHSTRPAAIQFGPTEAEQEHGFVAGTMGDGKPALIFHGQMRISPLTESEQEKIKKSEKGRVCFCRRSTKSAKRLVPELTIWTPLNHDRGTLKLGGDGKNLFGALSTLSGPS